MPYTTQLPPSLYALTVSIPPPPNNALSAEARMSWTQTPTADRHWLTILCPRSLQDSWLLSQSLELTTS